MPESHPVTPIVPARTVTWRQEYRPPAWRVPRIALTFALDAAETIVSARLELERTPQALTPGGEPAPLVLNGEGLETRRVMLDGRPLQAGRDYLVDLKHMTLAECPDRAVLETEVALSPQANTALMGLYLSGGILTTQCEAEAFRRITWAIDRPDVLSVYTTTLIADPARYPILLGNGNPVSQTLRPDGRLEAVWHDPWPKPSYLFALVAGPLVATRDRFTTLSGREVDLAIWTLAADADKTAHAMAALKDSMAWDERAYGREYDLDVFNIVAIPDFNMGAMENKGLNIFNAKYVLARPDTATDRDYDLIASVIAHEYFHNWSGNRVTCRDWFQLSLKEGFTVFRDQQFSADHASPAVTRIEEVRRLRQAQFSEDSGPLAHPVRPESYIEIDNFYTATVYEKGAEVVRMLSLLAGEAAFRRGCDLYFSRHDGQAVTCEDFLAAIREASGLDLEQFALWYDQAGTPVVTASGTHDPGRATWTLTLAQRTPPTPGQQTKRPLHIPVRLALFDPAGGRLPLHLEGEGRQATAPPGDPTATEIVLSLTAASQSWTFTGVPARPVPSLGRGFSAPVRWQTDLSRGERMALLAHDDDPVIRWDMAQELLSEEILAADAQPGGGIDGAVLAALGRMLDDPDAELALKALILDLPSLQVLAQGLEHIDFDTLTAARAEIRLALAVGLEGRLRALYQQLAPASATPEISPALSGARRLRGVALALLTQLAGPEDVERAERHYAQAVTMTDRMAALQALVALPPDAADGAGAAAATRALADFRQRFRDQPLVIDQWFSVQAGAEQADALERVQALARDPAFTLRNPNRVRALIGPFTGVNAAQFHRADGAGYAWLLGMVRALDPINATVAASLVTPLRIWRKLDPVRQTMVRTWLEELLDQPGLSDMVFERAKRIVDTP